MKPILEIQHISKKFRIAHQLVPYLSLREQLMETFKGRRLKATEEFWALDDVSFSIQQGESVGIIGRNGAGKSTLLKILSKITPPTKGKIIARGRIASLLEVGTGFHPELSGRENIFLNGSILGMRKKQVMQKLDEIVDFSGVEKFLDTPLKHYSSGMQLRLAFAVAAFLEPEILVIDEVLAVGDTEFQKKCIGKMDEVSRSGRTILFVSHQIGIVLQLCRRAILMQEGRSIADDESKKVVDLYLSTGASDNKFSVNGLGKSLGKFPVDVNSSVFIEEAYTVHLDGTPTSNFGHNQQIGLFIRIAVNRNLNEDLLSVALLDKHGNRVFTMLKPLEELHDSEKSKFVTLIIPAYVIAPNYYSFHFAVCKSDGTLFDIHEQKCRILVSDTGTAFSKYEGKNYGSVIIPCQWK